MRWLLMLFVAGSAGLAQERYYPSAAGDVSCPRMKATDDDIAGAPTRVSGPQVPRPKGSPAPNPMPLSPVGTPKAAAIQDAPKTLDVSDSFFPVDGTCKVLPVSLRRSVKEFKVIDKSGKPLAVGDKKGTVLVIGFWASYCQPSSIQLLELVDLQAKGQKFGFAVWPVNYDPERWARVIPYVQANRGQVGNADLFVPGIGKEGPSLLAGLIPALPAVFLVDKQGRLAAQYAGYQPNTLVKALKELLAEPE